MYRVVIFDYLCKQVDAFIVLDWSYVKGKAGLSSFNYFTLKRVSVVLVNNYEL